jgi:hypothetical protein
MAGRRTVEGCEGGIVEEMAPGKEEVVGDEEEGVEGRFDRLKFAVAVKSSHERRRLKIVPE